MDQNLVANALSLAQFVVALIIAVRGFYLFKQTRSRRLFILALSMLVFALTSAAGFAGDNITTISLNVDWFNYIGQTVSFLFILFSLLRSSDDYLRSLMYSHIVISSLLLILLLLAPVLPPDFPNPAITKSLLSGSRGVTCAVILFFYARSFSKKETLFALLMGSAFFLLAVGYFTILPKYFSPNDFLDRLGDILRIGGVLALLLALSNRAQ